MKEIKKVFVKGISDEVLSHIYDGVKYAIENDFEFIQDDWGVVNKNGKWESDDKLCCLLGACLIKENPDDADTDIAARNILNINQSDVDNLICGFDQGDDSTLFGKLGATWAKEIFGKRVFEWEDEEENND